jgi:riboflavin kinase/FMN adenylyltransferase
MATWHLHWREEIPTAVHDSMISIGNFDGVHRGHQSLLRRLRAHAQRQRVPATVITFDPHPRTLLRPQTAEPLLTTVAERVRRMIALGIDHVVVLQTDWSLLELEPEQFLQEVVRNRFAARGLVEGPSFTFGRGRRGNAELLVRWCVRHSLLADVVPPVVDDGEIVCSSRIRRALLSGDVAGARRWLGRPYAVSGKVGSGAGRGRDLGFPTANLMEVSTLIPGEGVYAGAVCWRGQRYPAAVHVGPNPTFDTQERKLEVFLVGFRGELYGASLTVQFLQRLRDVQRFDSAEALCQQIARDLEQVRGVFETENAV